MNQLPTELRALVVSYLPNNQAVKKLIEFAFPGPYKVSVQEEVATCNQILQRLNFDGKVVMETDSGITVKCYSGSRVVGVNTLSSILTNMIAEGLIGDLGPDVMDEYGLMRAGEINMILAHSGCHLRLVPECQITDGKMNFHWRIMNVLINFDASK